MKNKKSFLAIAAFSIWMMVAVTSCKKDDVVFHPVSDANQEDSTTNIFHGWPAGVDSVK